MKIVNIMLTLLCVAVVVSCTKDELGVENVNTKSFATYAKEFKNLNQNMTKAFKSSKNQLTTEDGVTVILENEVVLHYQEEEYLDLEFYNQMTTGTLDIDLTIRDLGLSRKATSYFTRLEYLNDTQDYAGMVNLLHQYKADYGSDPDLESLVGVFSVIELYQNELVLGNRFDSRDCEGSASALAGAAAVGAIRGAIWGFRLGSWFGPAGTAAGAIGGAIAGAVISSISNMGMQVLTHC